MLRPRLGILFFTVVLDLIGFGMVVPLSPLYASRYGASAGAIAWLLASYSLMQCLFAPLWGQLSDRVGRRPVLLASIAGNVCAQIMFACAPSYAWLLVARVLAGVCAANIAVANAYIADVTGPAERAQGMGLIGAAFGIGFVLGPFFGGELSRSAWGLSAPAWAAAALGALNWALALWRLPESLPPQADVPAVLQRPSAWRQRFQAAHMLQVVRPLYALSFAQIVGFSAMEMALVLFVHARLHFDGAQCGRLFAYTGLVLCLVQGGLIGRLVRRFGEVRLIAAGLFAVCLGLAGVPQTPAGAWGLILVPMALLAAGQAVLTPSISALLSRSVATQHQGAALGLLQSFSALARVVGPVLAGRLYGGAGGGMPFYVGACIVGIAGVACWPALSRLRPLA